MYNRWDFKTNKSAGLHLAAYILSSDTEAKQQVYLKDLGSMRELVKVLQPSKNIPEKAYTFLLNPFDRQIHNKKVLYIAPDGPLNLISFASLKLTDGRHLVQRQQVNRVLTGRDLLDARAKPASNELIAFGGVDYGEFPEGGSANKLQTGDKAKHLNMRAARELDGLAYLEHSSKEASLIAYLFKANCKGCKAAVYKKSDATEHLLKNLKRPPRILHLSTHGFYLQNEQLSTLADEAPLLLSGLALCGANRGLQGLLDEHGDDGLLYSIEVLGLNLQGTELVSLSACDTGKGVIDYSEGVYGLVRAFRTAGAQNVLMTLRPVGDQSASDFMEQFYVHWLNSPESISPAKALHQTRLFFIEHPENELYRQPEIWSPYVMVGR
jgi:CHAT domain-containing protein